MDYQLRLYAYAYLCILESCMSWDLRGGKGGQAVCANSSKCHMASIFTLSALKGCRQLPDQCRNDPKIQCFAIYFSNYACWWKRFCSLSVIYVCKMFVQSVAPPPIWVIRRVWCNHDAIQVSHGREIPKQPIFFFWSEDSEVIQCNARLIFSPCNQVRWTCIHCSDLYVHSGSRWRCSNPTAVFVSNNLWVASESVLTRQAVDVTHIWPWRQDVASVV